MKANRKFWRTVGFVTAPVLLLLLILINTCSTQGSEEMEHYYVTYELEGVTYTVEAVPGQVVLSTSDASLLDNILKNYIVQDAIEELGIYLIYVGVGYEGKFIEKIFDQEVGIIATPNTIYYPYELQVHIMDDFKTTVDEGNDLHGDIVQEAYIQAGGNRSSLHSIDVGYDGKFNSYEVGKALSEILASSSSEDKIIINMSFGPALVKDKKKLKWTDPEVTDEMRNSYADSFRWRILQVLEVINKCESRDVVVVMATGNEGMPNFQKEILGGLESMMFAYYLPWDYYNMKRILDSSIIFVSAKDDDAIYGNGVLDNDYNSLITKVDITDWKYSDGKHYSGTSFAAPMVAAMISHYSDQLRVSAEKALELIKNVTLVSDDQILIVEDVEEHFRHPSMSQILLDMEGRDFCGLMDIEFEDIVDASIVKEVAECNGCANRYTAKLKLKLSRYEIQMDASADVEYIFDEGIWKCIDMSFVGEKITAEEDYSSYVEGGRDNSGFLYGYSIFNKSDMDLWVGCELVLNSKFQSGVFAMKAHDKVLICPWGTPERCEILFAYKAEGVKHSVVDTLDADIHEVGIIAHRGFWDCEDGGYAPNSIAALRCAQEHYLWGSEFDVYMTKDEELIVYHDSRINGRKIEKNTFDIFKEVRLENGEPIPTVDQFLEQGRKYPLTKLVYELKAHSSNALEDRFVELTIEKLKAHDMLDPNRVMFVSFSLHMCEKLARKLPEFTVQYLSWNSFIDIDELLTKGIDGIDVRHGALKHEETLGKRAKDFGLSVNVWTVDEEEDIKRMLDMEVDQITTDDPLKVRELIDQSHLAEL